VLLRGVLPRHEARGAGDEAQGGGSIISTASVAGLRTGFGPHVYSAAKAAVIQLTARWRWSWASTASA
jgi:NAD(P)-dependent dehydrogenase (short-subunit alcohol dehydrogenase family)